MVYLQITEAILPEGTTHLATDWQVATDLLYNDVVLESLNDSVYTVNRVFNEVLIPGTKYYGRARYKLDTGYGPWGNIDVFVVDDTNDITRTVSAPSKISLPVITTDSDHNNHQASFFKIFADGYSSTSNSEHIATNWIMTDINDDVVLEYLNDSHNLNEISVNNIILKDKSVYRIKVSFISNSGDVSQMTSKLIYINNGDNFTLNTNLTSVNFNESLMVSIGAYGNITLMRCTILESINNAVSTVYDTSTNDQSLTIPAYTLEDNKQYTMVLYATIDGVTSVGKYKHFTTY